MSAKKLSALTDTELQERLKVKSAELDAIRVEHAALQVRLNKAYDAEKTLIDEVDRRTLTAGPTWEWLLEENGYASTQRYKACQAALGKLGLRTDSYNPDTGQRIVTVSLQKDDDEGVKLTYKALLELLPHIKLTQPKGSDSLPYAYVNVFEASLSEDGSYWLAINEAIGMYELRITRYYRERVVKKAPNLLELIKFLSTNCYYGSGSD